MRTLVLSGGPGHDFAATTAVVVEALGAAGASTTVVDAPGDAVAALAGEPGSWDLLVVNALRWSMEVERYAHLRQQMAFSLTDADAAVLDDAVHGGVGLLALHTAVICFDGHPRWWELVGARWVWERSSHRLPGPVHVTPTAAGAAHPVTADVAPFTVDDELYRDLELTGDVEPLLVADDGSPAPALWARRVGAGRVVTDLLGHGPTSLSEPEHRALLLRAARWAARAPVDLEAARAER